MLQLIERMGVGAAAATSLALIMHELATNSVTYGALSAAAGTLDVSSTTRGDEITLVWLERGGPRLEEPEGLAGFGSKLVNAVSRVSSMARSATNGRAKG